MNELKVIEYRNIRVLTTQQIAEAYEADPDLISKNFNNNKDKYGEGKHFICLTGKELKEAKANGKIYGLQQNANKFYLWTEKGAFLHAKSLNTDKAWEAYSNLIDGYYKQKDVLEGLSQEMMAIISIDRKQVHMEKRMDKLEYDVPLYVSEAEEMSRRAKRKGVKVLGGKNSAAYQDNSIRQKVYCDIYRQLKHEFCSENAVSYKAMKRKYRTDALSFIDNYEAPAYLREQINEVNAAKVA
jgi:hypothetical protein